MRYLLEIRGTQFKGEKENGDGMVIMMGGEEDSV